MEKNKHTYDPELNWIENFTKQFGGKVENNFVNMPKSIEPGIRYFLDCGGGISVYYLDVVHTKNFNFILQCMSDDFIGIYYNLAEGENTVGWGDEIHEIGRWSYNLTIIDGSLEPEYKIKAGSRVYALCVFIKKNSIKEFLNNYKISFPSIDLVLDSSKNTIVKFDRMSNESYHLLKDLRKLTVGEPVFNLNLIGTVKMLIADYLKIMSSERIIIEKVNKADLAAIIESQKYLIEHLEDQFPSIIQLAEIAEMCESKYKTLFRKITGLTPNKFFMDNKLERAKEMLSEKQLSITEVSNLLGFKHSSYFTVKFKEVFGVSPKLFVEQL